MEMCQHEIKQDTLRIKSVTIQLIAGLSSRTA
jgi:hypothetical protein